MMRLVCAAWLDETNTMATMTGVSDDSSAEVLEAFQTRLAEKGLKSTRQRQIIVKTFFELDRHISVDDLLVEVRRQRSSTGYATVYRTLKLLVELGFAHERHFGGADTPTLYDPLWGRDEHFHLICVDCESIVEFEDAELDRRHEAIAKRLGFAVQRQRLELYARCQQVDCPRRRARELDKDP